MIWGDAMAVDYFLIDAPSAVPREFEAWEAAKARHMAVFQRCLNAPDGSAEWVTLNTEGHAAKIEAGRLEQIARERWAQVIAVDANYHPIPIYQVPDSAD